MQTARSIALASLLAFEESPAPIDYANLGKSNDKPAERAFAARLVREVVRWRRWADSVIAPSSDMPLAKLDATLLQVLRLGTVEIHRMRGKSHAAVNENIGLLQKKHLRGYANAVLRKVAELDLTFDADWQEISREALHRAPNPHELSNSSLAKVADAASFPAWMLKLWTEEHGVQAMLRICEASNLDPAFVIRVNTLKTTRQQLQDTLAESAIKCRLGTHSPDALVLDKAPNLGEVSAWNDGWFYVQNEASQVAANMLAPKPGSKVVDLCASPGGKSTHLAQLMEDHGEIYSVDRTKEKARLIQENAKRLGLKSIQPVTADLFSEEVTTLLKAADYVLLDAPCTAHGALRKAPEGKWLKNVEDIGNKSGWQTNALTFVRENMRAKASLLYSVCTFTNAETDAAIKAANLKGKSRLFLPKPSASELDGHYLFMSA